MQLKFDPDEIIRSTINSIAKTSLPRQPRTDHQIQPDVPKRSQHCLNIAMRQAAFDGHPATVTDDRLLVGEPLPDDGEQIIGQVEDIGDGLVPDLATRAKRLREVGRNVNLAFCWSS